MGKCNSIAVCGQSLTAGSMEAMTDRNYAVSRGLTSLRWSMT